MQAMVEGKQRAFISDFAPKELRPKELRGIAWEPFHPIIGLAALPLGTFTGAPGRYVKPTATFLYGLILRLLRQR